jgi:hypothetical protein
MQASPLEVRPIADPTRPVAGAGRRTARAGRTRTAAGPAKSGVLEFSARERMIRCRDQACTPSATRLGQGRHRRLCQPAADLSLTTGRQPAGHRCSTGSWDCVPDRAGTSNAMRLGQGRDRRLCQRAADLSLTIGRQPAGHRWSMGSFESVPDRACTSSATRLGQGRRRRLCQPAAELSLTVGRQPAGHQWSMGSWESVPGGCPRRHGLPGSHGPSRMGFKSQKFNFRINPQHGSAPLQYAAAALVPEPSGARAGSLNRNSPVRAGTRHGARGRG